MLTQFVTILIIVSVIGCILYGRRLIRTEKVDAVFGNPERAKGGTNWVIVGTSAILMLWLYYSWDIAKGFYPKSANELCQVAKINESLLGLKYQFPIEEREFKSTSIIKIENKNLKKIANEINESPELNDQQKTILVSYIDRTSKLIPLLTSEELMEMDTKIKLQEITEEIKLLSSNFQKKDYPFETDAQKTERQKLIDEQGGWGITTIDSGSGSIENTIEIPTAPQTNRGLKFAAAAAELKLIDDKFFKLHKQISKKKNLKLISFGIKSSKADIKLIDIKSFGKKFRIKVKFMNQNKYFIISDDYQNNIQNGVIIITELTQLFYHINYQHLDYYLQLL